jgi:hypothetical protein
MQALTSKPAVIWPPHNPAPPAGIYLSGETEAARRPQVEDFIRGCFANAYGARIGQFMPRLMSLHDGSGTVCAALGMRPGGALPMYLEHYLDAPVEQVLAAVAGEPVARAGMVEVGNLAVDNAGGARWLIAALTAWLHVHRYRWVVFTGVPALRNAFTRLGIELLDLGAADASRLPPGEADRWGQYYAQRPRVLAGRVAQGHAVLALRFALPDAAGDFWRRAAQLAA